MVTRAEIINHMLRALGEGGVSYEASLHPTVQLCVGVLDTTNSEFQGRGFWFNKEHGMTLVQNNRGEVVVPNECLSLRVHGGSTPEAKQRYVVRAKKIYDSVAHTFNIDRPLVVDMVLKLDIDDMPPSAQAYLMHHATEAVFLDEDGDTQKLSKLTERTRLAWQALKATEMKEIGTNALDNPFARQLHGGLRPYSAGRNPNYIGGR